MGIDKDDKFTDIGIDYSGDPSNLKEIIDLAISDKDIQFLYDTIVLILDVEAKSFNETEYDMEGLFERITHVIDISFKNIKMGMDPQDAMEFMICELREILDDLNDSQ